MPTTPKNTPKTKGKPIFVGKSALVRLINENDPNAATIWLVDPTNKTLRPFVSEDQFDKLFDNPAQAMKAVVTLSSNELSPGGVLEDYQVLDSNYGVGADGSMKDVEFSKSQLQGRYGQPINEGGEKNAVGVLDKILGTLGPRGASDNINLNASEGEGNSTLPGGVPISPEDVPNTLPQAVQGVEQPIMAPQGPMGVTGRGGKGGKGNYDGRGGDINTYGTTNDKRTQATEQSAQQEIGGLADLNPLLKESFVNWLKSTPSIMGFYIGALVYGNYTTEDIVADMVRRQKGEDGDKTMDDIAFIDPSLTKSQFIGTDKQKISSGLIDSIVPPNSMVGVGNWDVLKKYNLYELANKMPEFFKEVTNTVDITDPKTINEIEAVKEDFLDQTTLVASANTEQERLQAKQNLDLLQANLLRDYGLKLSGDITTAWEQLNTLEDTYSQRGIEGSGMEAESEDTYLEKVRAANEITRNAKNDAEAANKKAYYQTNASDMEISSLTDAERIAYGLKPSKYILDNFSVAALKRKYPDLDDKTIQEYHDAILYTDDLGIEMLRSSKYGALMDITQKAAVEKFKKQTDDYLQLKVDEQKDAYLKMFGGVGDPESLYSSASPTSTSNAPTTLTPDKLVRGTYGTDGNWTDPSGNVYKKVETGKGTSDYKMFYQLVTPNIPSTPPVLTTPPGEVNEGKDKMPRTPEQIAEDKKVQEEADKLKKEQDEKNAQDINNDILSSLSGSISYGSTGKNVTDLQNYLKSLGYFTQDATTYYGNATRDAVKKWQEDFGINGGVGTGNWGTESSTFYNTGKATTAALAARRTGNTTEETTPTTQQKILDEAAKAQKVKDDAAAKQKLIDDAAAEKARLALANRPRPASGSTITSSNGTPNTVGIDSKGNTTYTWNATPTPAQTTSTGMSDSNFAKLQALVSAGKI